MRCVFIGEFAVPAFDMQILENLPRVTHVYGTAPVVPSYLHWMEYDTEGHGQIAFVRGMAQRHPEFIGHIATALGAMFPQIKFDPGRINILRTRGCVVPHVDESNRSCCINIGWKNSASAITWSSELPRVRKPEFKEHAVPQTCEDGKAYLLDTSKLHSVEGSEAVDRYLISYGFGIPFEDVLTKVRGLHATERPMASGQDVP
jgi:hypothetical protein